MKRQSSSISNRIRGEAGWTSRRKVVFSLAARSAELPGNPVNARAARNAANESIARLWFPECAFFIVSFQVIIYPHYMRALTINVECALLHAYDRLQHLGPMLNIQELRASRAEIAGQRRRRWSDIAAMRPVRSPPANRRESKASKRRRSISTWPPLHDAHTGCDRVACYNNIK